jgi:hypothetical protein
MELPHQSVGRGRGRHRTATTDSSSSHVSASAIPKTTDVDVPPSSNDVSPPVTTQTTTVGGRGRGAYRKRKDEVPDPYWTVTDLTVGQFKTNNRPTKPLELGKYGEQIEVMVNYFPIKKFPDSGFVYQYDIQIRNRRDHEIPIRHRR